MSEGFVTTADGTVTLDFNRTCAYHDADSYPLPPAEKRLPLPIDAGGKDFAKWVRRAQPVSIWVSTRERDTRGRLE